MEDLMETLLMKIGGRPGLEMPPKAFLYMEGKIASYEKGEGMTAFFPVKKSYANPFGFMQGGFVVAAVDNTFGPLSLLEKEPSVTTHLSTIFLRPISCESAFISVTARVVAKTKKTLHMEAEVQDERGALCMRCQASFAVV